MENRGVFKPPDCLHTKYSARLIVNPTHAHMFSPSVRYLKLKALMNGAEALKGNAS